MLSGCWSAPSTMSVSTVSGGKGGSAVTTASRRLRPQRAAECMMVPQTYAQRTPVLRTSGTPASQAWKTGIRGFAEVGLVEPEPFEDCEGGQTE
jgi:hypothetical protein